MMKTTSRFRLPSWKLVAWVATACCVWIAAGVSAQAQPALEYNRDVRPILAETCFACHGPDSAARKAGLRLDQRDAAIDYGAIVPGDPDASTLIERVFSDDADLIMPPPQAHKTLSESQKNTLRQWIAEGAEYQPHWSFIAPVRPQFPDVQNAAWVRNPIDRFVLARLEALNLTPAPEADRRTLARRVALDLTGLPPSPEELQRFLDDDSPQAYEAYVDRLLASDRWGEHRARYWLDYARYADTHGIHFDNYREMWSYRDWVINAFNRNMPYDEFTIKSLAGDLLPDATLDDRLGSGFNRCHMTTNEGGIIDEEYLVLYTRDRTETTSQVWLGLTANCAVCHDHKFDPLSQAEFYELSAFFNNTTQGARDGNIKDAPPVVIVPRDEDRDRWQALQTLIPAQEAEVDRRRIEGVNDFDAWLDAADPQAFAAAVPQEGLQLRAPLSEGEGQLAEILVRGAPRELSLDESVAWQPGEAEPFAAEVTGQGLAEIDDVGDFDSDQPYSIAAWIRLPANDSYGAIASRMDNEHDYRGWDFWVESRRVGMHLVHQWNGDALKVVSQNQVPANTWTHVLVTYDGSRRAAGVNVYFNGQKQPTQVQADALKSTTRTDVPFKIGQRNTSDPLTGLQLQDLRLYERRLDEGQAQSLAQASKFASWLATDAALEQNQRDELFAWWLNTLDPDFQQAQSELQSLQRERDEIQRAGTVGYVMQEKPDEPMAFVLQRGEYDRRGEPVTPDTPAILPPFPDDWPRNRLGFARWLLLPEHPLTARVTVNRYWHEVFGRGIVSTIGDFGITGTLPTHPELLDWLALDFQDHGWDVKHLFKQIVMSATYRQAAQLTPEKLEKDPDNAWLSRGPRFRMDAEMIRDYALASSGLLVEKIGGPSVKPYQPPGVWEAIAMNVSNTRQYVPDSGDKLYRRSLYTFWKRMAPPASMEIFNAPNREFCVVERERTNTPLQALVTLNGEQFIEAARCSAQQALLNHETFEARLDEISQHLLLRSLTAREQDICRASLDELLAHYTQHVDDASALLAVGEQPVASELDPATLAAWTLLVNELMNLDEVLNK